MGVLSRVAQGAYVALRASGLPRWRRRPSSGAVIFCFHNVVPDQIAGQAGDYSLHVSVSAFSAYVDWIKAAYTVVSVRELLDRLRAERPVGGLAVLTFDDGYDGVLTHGVPVMRAASMPFAIFPVVNTATEPRPFWWDVVRGLTKERRDRYLTTLAGDGDRIIAEQAAGAPEVPRALMPAPWKDLRGIRGDDCTIGAHTVTHRNLTVLPPEQLVWELTESRRRLGDELGVSADVVAYPYGEINPAVLEATGRAGYAAGLSFSFGLNRDCNSPFELRRVAVPQGMRVTTLACWAAGLRLRASG